MLIAIKWIPQSKFDNRQKISIVVLYYYSFLQHLFMIIVIITLCPYKSLSST